MIDGMSTSRLSPAEDEDVVACIEATKLFLDRTKRQGANDRARYAAEFRKVIEAAKQRFDSHAGSLGKTSWRKTVSGPTKKRCREAHQRNLKGLGNRAKGIGGIGRPWNYSRPRESVVNPVRNQIRISTARKTAC